MADLDADGLRVAQLARHELAVAFGGARLREAFERERHELSAVVDGATDVILQVDETRRVVRLNPAGERMLGNRRRDGDRPVMRRGRWVARRPAATATSTARSAR